MLDNFVANCIEVTLDDGLAYGSRDKDGCKRPQVEHPTIDLKSLDVEWKSLPSDLMYKILNFPTLIADANSYISAVLDYEAGPPDYEEFFEARTVKYAELGLLAISIIETLRKKCNWPEDVTHEEGWSPKERLSKARKKILDSIERRKLGNHHLLSHLTKGDDKA